MLYFLDLFVQQYIETVNQSALHSVQLACFDSHGIGLSIIFPYFPKNNFGGGGQIAAD